MEVRIEYTVDARDLFPRMLALAKFRILLGLGFVLMTISGLVAFFLTIDEGHVLLQTSPLFIGIPLLAVGSQCCDYTRPAATRVGAFRHRNVRTDSSFQISRMASTSHSVIVPVTPHGMIFKNSLRRSQFPRVLNK